MEDLLAAATAGSKLRAFRGLKDWTQSDLGNELGVDKGWISRLEAGESTPSLELGVKIERLAGILVSEWTDLDEQKAAIA